MQTISDFLVNIKFRNRLILSYILIALIPFSVFALVCGGVLLSQAQKTAVDHTGQIVEQVSSSIDVYIGTIDKIATMLSGTLDEELQSEDWGRYVPEIQKNLKNIAQSHPEIAGILVAGRNDRFISTGMDRISRDPFSQENWYRQAQAHPDQMVLISDVTGRNIVTREDYSIDNVFSLARAVPDASGAVAGVILIDVKHDIIESSINNITIGENGFVFVTDYSNEVVYTGVNPVVYRVNPKWLDSEPQMPITASISGEQYSIRYIQSPYTGWKTVGVFSSDEIMGSVNSVFYVFVVSIMILSVLVLCVSFYISDTVLRPVLKLRNLMKQAESGDFSVRFLTRYNDEIGELGHSFNHMIDRLEELIHMVYEEQQSKRNAELKSLQEQIKPHFLYNTLDTIGWMAREYEADEIVRLIDALTSMFRIGLSHGKDFITLREEITHVSNYLYIQEIRYKDKLSYDIQVPEAYLQYRVPKLILQPLVENAIYHGVKSKRGSGHIQIRVEESEDELLRIIVQDDGAGIPAERLQELRKQLSAGVSQEEKQSFGLFYIQERIRLSYGTEFGLQIDSIWNEGTVLALTIPRQNA